MGVFVKTAADEWTNLAGGKSGGGELPGIGGWATVSAASGTVEEKTYNDGNITWKVYKFTDDGSVTCSTEGLVEVLAVGSGGAASASGTYKLGGGAGGVTQELTQLEAIENPVIVGKGENSGPGDSSYVGTATGIFGAYGGSSSGASSGAIGSARPAYVRIVPGQGHFGHAVGHGGGGGAEGEGTSTEGGPGRVINFDGDGDVEYGRGGEPEYKGEQAPGIGQGGYAWNGSPGGPYPGGDGIVLVRVPAENAASVSLNVYGWESFALVDDGVVTDVVKVPDNQPRTMEEGWLACPNMVRVGWEYVDGEFVSPVVEEGDTV